MARRAKGNLKGLAPNKLKKLQKLLSRSLDKDEIVSFDVAKELFQVASELGRRIGLLISREGRILEVFVGTREILYIPDLGRYRYGKGRLRRLRLIFSDLSTSDHSAFIPADIYADLEKLRLDMVVSIKASDNRIMMTYAHLLPVVAQDQPPVATVTVKELAMHDFDFVGFITDLEDELDQDMISALSSDKPGAFLIGVYDKRKARDAESHMLELTELSRTAGLDVLGQVVQKRAPDPRTLLGKGKLEEVVLRCLRVGAEVLIFDTELKPSQWRVITNSTDLKVLDRSMLILDIFAQRAKSSDGRLQVELAQLKYNLPRLVEKDLGLSRLTGGIGGRGPGETKLEIGRRRARDRINNLEKRIKKLSNQRGLQRSRRQAQNLPLIAVLGYTNAGKSTLFNALTSSAVFVEDKLFATLEPAQRRLVIPHAADEAEDELGEIHPHGRRNSYGTPVVLSDTVGFIRELPEELMSAFRATLEELYEAKLLIHVVDLADDNVIQRKASVDKILQAMGLADLPQIVVLNKIDLVPEAQLQSLVRELEGLPVSAINKEGFSALFSKMREMLGRDERTVEEAPGRG
ncbi:GTPase HflX, partial [Oligoflexia bacterium]|nr:GTPase HflX [Oligoflexia bacterium]